MTYLSVSLSIIAILAPILEPTNANPAETSAIFRWIFPDLKKLITDRVVPKLAENLFVPAAVAGGRPTAKYMGKDISPPPPAIESINPARKIRGQTIKYVKDVTCI